ncbi:HopJ type III effector protein [Pseudoalteromonas sp. T1lg65]|uniref:HopJ type III effector protein n=1 Tax=Pseudoalteromonas sp. T1lg65 TaxID=2077101 RepID=UPI003F7B0223
MPQEQQVTLHAFITQLKEEGERVEFEQSIALIDQLYHFTPVAFSCGEQHSEAGTNQGSCKIFAFAQLHELSEQATLHCFGRYYREDVLQNPEGSDHGNIRNFIKFGWQGVKFSESALEPVEQ